MWLLDGEVVWMSTIISTWLLMQDDIALNDQVVPKAKRTSGNRRSRKLMTPCGRETSGCQSSDVN